MTEPQLLYTIPRQQTRTHIKKPYFLSIGNKYIFKNYNIIFNSRPVKSILGLPVKHVYLYDTQWIVDWYFMKYQDDDNVTFNINGSWHRQWPREPYHLQLNIISQKYSREFAFPIHIIRLDNGMGMQTHFSNPIMLKNPLILQGMGLGWDIHQKDATTGHDCDIFPVAGQYTGQNDNQGNPIIIPETPATQQRSEASKYFYMPANNFWPQLYKDETRPPAIIYDPYYKYEYYQQPTQPAKPAKPTQPAKGQGMKQYSKNKKTKRIKYKSFKHKHKHKHTKNIVRT